MNYAKTALLLAAMTALFLGVGYLLGGPTGAILAFLFALGTNAYAYWNSDKLALRMHGARQVTRGSAPEFVGLIEELAQRADIPAPRVFVIDSEQPNAFATGRNPQNAAVAATTGLMRMLTREELAGVMAHELAHIKNRDTLIMTVAATVAGAISMLAQFGLFFGGGDRRDNALGIVGVLLAALLAPFAAMMIQMLISRTREYSADREGATICGRPVWLETALAKISGQAARYEMASVERNPASAHLFIVNPLSGRRMDNLFATHPSTENRISALRELAREMGQSGAGPELHPERITAAESRLPRTGQRRGPSRGPWA